MLSVVSAVLTSLGPTVTIAPGVSMPSINLGTCCGSEPKVGLDPWLGAGGTGIDTAWDYHDQVDIRSGLAKHPEIKRDQLFITTKVPAGFGNSTDCNPDPEITVRYVKENLVELGVDQVDLVLIHRPCQPAGSPRGPAKDPVASNNALWAGAQKVLAMNLTRAIGVSNYATADLEALKGPKPSVNQCRMSVETHDDDTIAYCQAHGILYEAYFAMKGCPFTDATAGAIAKTHNVSVSQVCLRYILERGCAMAVGTGADASKASAYAKENLDIYSFSLSAAEVKQLEAIAAVQRQVEQRAS
jgi:diketogulonate reductase-like aldo/keto reductase